MPKNPTHPPAWAALTAVLLLGGCMLAPGSRTGLMDVSERPAEKALLGGMRAYDDAQYAQAEALQDRVAGRKRHVRSSLFLLNCSFAKLNRTHSCSTIVHAICAS